MKYVSKGWGYELWIANNDDYCGKLLHVVKDRHLSFHFHKKKSETFYVQNGKMLVFLGYGTGDEKKEAFKKYMKRIKHGYETVEEIVKSYESGLSDIGDYSDVFIMGPGDVLDLPAGTPHSAYALETTEFFEFSTLHEDSDSYRIVKGD